MSEILLFLSAPADVAKPVLLELLHRHASDNITMYLRDCDREGLPELSTNVQVRSDKPRGGKLALIRELRRTKYEIGYALGLGHWSYWPAKVMLLKARAKQKIVRTERGDFPLSRFRPLTLAGHFWWRHKHPVGCVAGMPEGTAYPVVYSIYRKTIGCLLGVCWQVLRYAARYVTP